MKTGKVNIMIVATLLLALTGCSTVPAQQLSEKYDRPILSAAEARSMISVEVTLLEPMPEAQTVLASNRFDNP